MRIIAATLESRPLPPSHHRAEVPCVLDELVLRMLSSDRALRPADGRALLGELLAIGTETSADAEGPRSELTATEEHLESVVFVMERAGTKIAETPTIDLDDATPSNGRRGVDARDRKIMRALVDAHGGRLVTRTDGTLLLVVAEHRVATDQAVSALRLALSVHRLAPDAWITVLTGRGLSHQPAAPAFDASLVRDRSHGVHVDDVTAARGVPVVLTAERVARERFHFRIDVAFAPAGAHGRLSTHTVYTIEALARSLRGCARARLRENGTLTLFLDGAPHPDVLAGVMQRVLGATTGVAEPELSQATPYRDSPGSGRARAA